ASCLGMRSLQHLDGLLNGREETKRMRDKWNIAVDGFGDSHHAKLVTSLLGLLKQYFGAALRAIAANREEDIDAPAHQVVHRTRRVYRATRGAQNGAGLQVNPIYYFRCEDERFVAVFRIQPLISPPKPEHLFYAVGVMHLEKQRPD